jgi:hypothetical protein
MNFLSLNTIFYFASQSFFFHPNWIKFLFCIPITTVFVSSFLMSFLRNSRVYSYAYLAVPMTIFCKSCIRGIVRMTRRAMSFFEAPVVCYMVCSLAIFFMCNLVEMIRIYAGSIFTKMIKAKEMISFSDKMFVRGMIGKFWLPINSKNSIASCINKSVPVPAPVFQYFNFLEKSFEMLIIHFNIIPITSVMVNIKGAGIIQ